MIINEDTIHTFNLKSKEFENNNLVKNNKKDYKIEPELFLKNEKTIIKILNLSENDFRLKYISDYDILLVSKNEPLTIHLSSFEKDVSIEVKYSVFSMDFESFKNIEYSVFKKLENLMPNIYEYKPEEHSFDFSISNKAENFDIFFKNNLKFKYHCEYNMKIEFINDNNKNLTNHIFLILLLLEKEFNSILQEDIFDSFKGIDLFKEHYRIDSFKDIDFSVLKNNDNYVYKTLKYLKDNDMLILEGNKLSEYSKDIIALNYEQ